MTKYDPNQCYNKDTAHPDTDPECLKCNGYESRCEYYVSNKEMEVFDNTKLNEHNKKALEERLKTGRMGGLLKKLWKK